MALVQTMPEIVSISGAGDKPPRYEVFVRPHRTQRTRIASAT